MAWGQTEVEWARQQAEQENVRPALSSTETFVIFFRAKTGEGRIQ